MNRSRLNKETWTVKIISSHIWSQISKCLKEMLKTLLCSELLSCSLMFSTFHRWFSISSLISAVLLTPHLLSPQCSSCDGSSARCWCLDCNEALCDICVSAHRRVTLTRSHRILNQPPAGQITIYWSIFTDRHSVPASPLLHHIDWDCWNICTVQRSLQYIHDISTSSFIRRKKDCVSMFDTKLDD